MRYLFSLFILTSLLFSSQTTRDMIRATPLKVDGKVLGKVEDFGKYYAVLIAVENYDHLTNLKTPFEDIDAVASLLQNRFGFEKPVIIKDPSNSIELIDKLDEITNILTNKDNLLIYYAGHGNYDKRVQTDYWQLKGAQKHRRSTWLPLNTVIRNTLKLMPAKHVLVVADSCHSGALTRNADLSIKMLQKNEIKYYSKLMHKKSRKALTSGGLEPVLDDDGLGGKHSIFAKAFMNTLKNNEKEIFSTEEIFPHIKKIVGNNAVQSPEYGNILETGVFHLGGDFVFLDYTVLKKKNEDSKNKIIPSIKESLHSKSKELERCIWFSEQSDVPNSLSLDKKVIQICREIDSVVAKGNTAKALIKLNKKEEAKIIFEEIKTLLDTQCNDANRDACHVMGHLSYIYDKDSLKSNNFYKKACQLGHGPSCNTLGARHEKGKEVSQDYTKAFNLYIKSCSLNAKNGCYNLGRVYQQGKVIKRNGTKAIKYYTRGCTLNSGHACVQLGLMYQTGINITKDDSKAIEFYAKSCELDNGNGCNRLGLMYQNEVGVSKDEAKASVLYKKACKLQNGQGCHNLGWMYEHGKGVKKNEDFAIMWYVAACELKNGNGCSQLGTMLEVGKGGIEKNEVQAVELYTKSCDYNSSHGCHNLGWMYQNGKGVSKDLSKAVTLYTKACHDLNYGNSCNRLGVMYKTGQGVTKDASKAVTLYTKACDMNVSVGCDNLGWMYQNGKGVSKDLSKAVTLYTKACHDLNYGNSCNRLGVMYITGQGVTKDASKAVTLYTKACDLNVSVSCRNLGNMYKTGEGVSKNETNALSFHQKGCNLDNADACWNVGYFYRDGIGTQVDLNKARKFYTKACELNSSGACLNLGKLYEDGKGVANDVHKALKFYQKSCDLNSSSGCFDVAWLYDKGKEVSTNAKKAIKYYKKACDLYSNTACRNLGITYRYGGLGVTINRKKAIDFYKKSCKLGNKKSCTTLKSLKVNTNFKYSLTINPTPSNAEIYIMNIKPRYKDGIELKKGIYNIKVVADGYETKKFDIYLNEDIKHDITLEKKDQYTNDFEGYGEIKPLSKTKFLFKNNKTEKIIDLKGKDFIVISVREKGSDGRFYAVNKRNGAWLSGGITSGANIFPTPSGIWNVNSKKRYHTSVEFPSEGGGNNMNYSLFFSSKKLAIHEGSLNWMTPDGCVQIETDNMKTLFNWSNLGLPILVTRHSYMKHVKNDLRKIYLK